MKLNNKQFYNFIAIVFILFSVSSCISSRKINYIQKEAGKAQGNTKFTRKPAVYKLQADDNVWVKFSSLEPVSNLVFSGATGFSNMQSLEAKYKNVYQIDTAGYVSIPQLNKIKAEGLTTLQLKDTLEKKIQRYYQQVTAQVRLADNYVTILGKVNKPGRYLVDFTERISIFEAIGLASDLNIEGNRKKAKLIRNYGDTTEVVTIDLTKRNVIEDEYYYLMPNDVLYIEPLRAMSWHRERYPFATTLALILSTATSILVIASYLK